MGRATRAHRSSTLVLASCSRRLSSSLCRGTTTSGAIRTAWSSLPCTSTALATRVPCLGRGSLAGAHYSVLAAFTAQAQRLDLEYACSAGNDRCAFHRTEACVLLCDPN